MHFPFTTKPAVFCERPNRFRIVAQLRYSGETVSAHCPNPGRLGELLIPGATVHLSRAANPNRKTAWDLRFVEHPENSQLISLDTRLPNAIFREGLETDFFEPFHAVQSIAQEVPLRHDAITRSAKNAKVAESRIDFRLIDAAGKPCWVEVKSVTLVEDGLALFPDAPTTRGRRHVEELTELVKHGERAAVVFIIQRPDAVRLRPQRETDPDFARALVAAHEVGVAVYAYTCRLTTVELELAESVPVHL